MGKRDVKTNGCGMLCSMWIPYIHMYVSGKYIRRVSYI